MTERPFCYVCKRTDRELRPYGKGGKPICHPCMKADPEREREANRQMDRAFGRVAGVPVIGSEEGPLSQEEAAAKGLPFVMVDLRGKGPKS
jgi:hypothetical protein